MSREGVAIKVKIGLRENGHADHPNWGLLPMVKAGTTPESQQIVKWKYDKCGHCDEHGDSPVGMQWGMMIVTEQYANEAVATFPDLVTIITEAEAEDFWECKAHAHMPENRANSQVLTDLNSELQLRKALGQDTTALEEKIINALDPDNPEAGLVRDKQKKFADAKISLGFTIKQL